MTGKQGLQDFAQALYQPRPPHTLKKKLILIFFRISSGTGSGRVRDCPPVFTRLGGISSSVLIQMPICCRQIGGGKKIPPSSGLDGLFACLFFLSPLLAATLEEKGERIPGCARDPPSPRRPLLPFLFDFIFTGSSQLGASIIGEQGASGGAGVVSHCLGCPGAPGTPVGIKVALIKCGPRRTALCIAGANREPASHPPTTASPRLSSPCL